MKLINTNNIKKNVSLAIVGFPYKHKVYTIETYKVRKWKNIPNLKTRFNLIGKMKECYNKKANVYKL